MASGCVFGNCPVCNEIVWEDDFDIYKGMMMHPECIDDLKRREQRSEGVE